MVGSSENKPSGASWYRLVDVFQSIGPYAVNFTDCVQIGNKLVAWPQCFNLLNLKIFVWIMNTDAILSRKCFEQMDSLM